MPIIGRIVKYTAEKNAHSTKPRQPFRGGGTHRQIVPLEDAIAILQTCAAEPIIEKNCMCGICHADKEACCINFGVMSEIVDKLPRFIRERQVFFSPDSRISIASRSTIKRDTSARYGSDVPYINIYARAPAPNAPGSGPRFRFRDKINIQGEYIVDYNPDACNGLQGPAWRCASSRR